MTLNKQVILINSLLIIFLVSFNFSECVTYKAKPLDSLEIVSEKAQTISFNSRVFTKADCKKFLGRSNVISNGYQPIQISFTNNSSSHFTFSLANFSLKCLAYDEVAENVQFSTIKRVIGWSVAALFIWPLIIPAIIEGVEAPKANDRLESDYFAKALTTQIVKPFTTINGLIFVCAEDFDSKFSFTVADLENDERFVLSTSDPINNLPEATYASDIANQNNENMA